MMKNIFIYTIIAILGFISSCQKVIDLKLKDSTPQYVIEGEVNSGDSVQTVLISKSVLFGSDNSFPTVSGAIVTIKDNSINYTETLTEVSPGKYISQHLHGVEGRGYTLTVVVDGKTFTSTSIIPSKVLLDNVSFIDDSFNEGAKIAIPVRNDPAGIQNNYLFDLYLKRATDSKGWIRDSALMVVDDVFSDGVTTQQPLFGILKLMPNDSIRVTMKCIDRNVYKYFYSLSLNGPNGAATPANPVSNISGGCLGYFSAHTKQTLTKIIPQ